MAHWHSSIMFFVKTISYKSNHRFRNYLAYKYSTPLPFFTIKMPDIKPEIYFFKINVERPFYPNNLRVLKKESNHTNQNFTLPKIKNCKWWQVRFQDIRINFIIKHQ